MQIKEFVIKLLFWIYIGILFTVIEVMAYLFWKMLVSQDHILSVGEPNELLFYTELVILTFAAVFTFVFSYMVTLGKYRVEIVNRDGLTRDEIKKAKDNYKIISSLKTKLK